MTVASRLGGPVVATVGIHGLLMAVYLWHFGGDPSAFVCAGANRVGKPPYEAVTCVCGPSGHDGQFYYSLARAPLTRHGDDLDLASYRHVRIIFPALCWAVSGGSPWFVFYAMPAVNLVAIAAMAGIGAAWAMRHGRNPWWGLLLPVGLNAGISLIHNFTDCLSSLAVVGLLAAWLSRRPAWLITLLAAAAVFSREQNLFAVGLIGVFALVQARRDAVLGIAVAVAAWVGWVGLLVSAYGQLPLVPGDQNLALPLRGIVFRISQLGQAGGHVSTRLAIVQGFGLLHLLLLLAAGVCMLRWRIAAEVRALLAAGVVLAVVTGTGPYTDFSSYLRVFAWVPIGMWFGSMAAGRSWPLWLMTPAFLCSLAAALRWA